MSGVPAKPGCDAPLMTTGSVIVGRGEVGLMVCTPGCGMLKVIVFVPVVALASRMACRSEPAP
jgi:hypothetical protein